MKNRCTWFTLLLMVGMLLLWSSVCAQSNSEEQWQEAWQEIASQGEGFVVWESSRTGRWRIWMRQLDGTGLQLLSPNEEGRDHFCPHLSPDGKTMLYLSYPEGKHSYQNPQPSVPMHLLEIETGVDRVLVEDACAYGEDRAAVWLSSRQFVYIGGDGLTYQFDLWTNKATLLTQKTPETTGWAFGWLVNPTMTHATTGEPTFSPYSADEGTIAPRKKQGGCQPYFSRDGRWGFWMGGGGGPIRAFDLATSKVKNIIEKDDPRMPSQRGYLYFPMLSADGQLFAFGSSPNQHDHFKSDYDIFISRIDPVTLEIIGKPARYTFHEANDRFPDVFVRPLELGRHRGEAPFRVTLTPENEDTEWVWSFGDGEEHRGKTAQHTYRRPGNYRVEARQGMQTLIGHVQAMVPEPPQVLETILRGKQAILVQFDEPIRVAKRKARLDSKTKIREWEVSADGYHLVLHLDRPLDKADWLWLEGITDQAQRPNKLPAQRLRLEQPVWPGSQDGLVFLWQNGSASNLIRDPETGDARSYSVKARGRAHLDHNHAMRLAKGAYAAEDAGQMLLAACKATNELTIEAVIFPDSRDQDGPARIVSLSSDPSSRNFTLGQQDQMLVLRLRTPRTGTNGANPELPLCKLSFSQPTHVLVTYQPGLLKCYRDGELVLETDAVQGGFSNWTEQHLILGDEWSGERDWAGTLEGIAIYSRALSPKEVHAHARGYRALLLGRSEPQRWSVKAKLVAQSDAPTLEQISPYREALVIHEYEVELGEQTHEPAEQDLPNRIRVVQWAILDGEKLPESHPKQNTSTQLILETLDANPQLRSVYLSDTLELDFDVPIYVAIER